jgi:hypothetical protein
MVIGSDGKWSKALKAAFIQASPTGRVKMLPAPAFRNLNRGSAGWGKAAQRQIRDGPGSAPGGGPDVHRMPL